MDFASVSLAIAALAFCVAALGAVIEYKSIKISMGIQKWLEHESEARPTVIEELDTYLSDFDEETKMTRLEAIGSVIGARMFQSLRFSNMQEASVRSKIQNKYDEAVNDGIKRNMPPQYKVLFKIAKELGFDLDEILEAGELNEFINSLQKYGVNPSMAGSSSGNSAPTM